MHAKPLDSHSIQDLAQACAAQTNRRRAPPHEHDPCYELFRRAFSAHPDDDAWQVMLHQYQRLISHWLGQYDSKDAVQDVFLRAWRAQQNARAPFTSQFSNTSAVMGYLRQCAVTVRIGAWREDERQRVLLERLKDAALVESILARAQPDQEYNGFHLEQFMLSKLNDAKERVVFEGIYYYGLVPREIQTMRPDLFPDVHMVYRVKENILKRLKRDQEFQEWGSKHPENDDAYGEKK